VPGYYPVMLDIRERPVTVIGGDRIAAEKAATLADSGARVSVISPTFSAEMLELAERGLVRLCRKAYEPGDLAGAFIVVAATTDQATIEAIWRETQERNQPVNIVDVPRYCSFILPSILRRGKLTIAVSTEGASPALAKRIRQQLEEDFPPAYEAYIELAALVRAHLRWQGVAYEMRDEFFQQFMASPVLALLESGEIAHALEVAAELLSAYGVEIAWAELEQTFSREQSYAASPC
jgi:precorrin-2 dehydrogenase/sirohydrochlorin ferrochelatase